MDSHLQQLHQVQLHVPLRYLVQVLLVPCDRAIHSHLQLQLPSQISFELNHRQVIEVGNLAHQIELPKLSLQPLLACQAALIGDEVQQLNLEYEQDLFAWNLIYAAPFLFVYGALKLLPPLQ